MASLFVPAPIRLIGRVLFSLFVIGFGIWSGFAFWFQLPFGNATLIGILFVWALFMLSILVGSKKVDCRRPRYLMLLIAVLCVIGWWSTIRPSLDRLWALDVANTVTGSIDGSSVVLHNIRDFDWQSTDEFTPHWKTATYDLDTITSVDIFLSYWGSPAIAHTLVSFGFADGRHLVFSAEIRKEHHEEYSALGGFFRKFELAMIAAEESDIIYTRTNARGEDVYRYPLRIDAPRAKALFLNYVETANGLAVEPRFYNTLTTNCTTVIFKLARLLDPSFPFDYRILLSGFLPGYLFDNNLISTEKSLAETMANARINEKAVGGRDGYSQRIRQ